MRIGPRTIKTAVAVTLTIFIVNLLETKINAAGYNIAAMAAITAIIGIQPSVKGSLVAFKNRTIATFIGSLMAIIIAMTLGPHAVYIGLGSVAIILICLKLKISESIRLALVTLVAVGIYHGDFNIMQIAYRTLGIFIGLIVSTGINALFLPPDYTDDLRKKISNLRLKFEGFFETAISDILRKEKTAKEDIKEKRQAIRDELEDARDIYSLLLEDVSPEKKKRFVKFRRSINAIQSNLERLMAIHRSIVFMPAGPKYDDMCQELFDYLYYLLALHRQIYDHIVTGKGYHAPELTINAEAIQEKIIELIKTDSNEKVLELYNLYFEATRIDEKLQQLKEEFEL